MAAFISRELMDLGRPVLAQVLIYPVTQITYIGTPSHLDNQNGPITSLELSIHFSSFHWFGKEASTDLLEAMASNRHTPYALRKKMVDNYVSKVHESFNPNKITIDFGPADHDQKVWESIKPFVLDEEMFPLLPLNVSGLPPTFVYTAQHDSLSYDGAMYVWKLQQQGVEVKHVHEQAGYHGIFMHEQMIKEAGKLHQDIADFILVHV